MAVVHGIPGSWKSVRRLLGGEVPQCDTPDQLALAVESLAAGRTAWTDEATAEVHEVVRGLTDGLPALEAAVLATMDEGRNRVASEARRLRDTIRRLAATSIPPLRWFNALVRIPPLRKQLERLEGEPERRSMPERHTLARARKELEWLVERPDSEVALRVARREARLARLREIQSSPEYVGAIAECQMATLLALGLPEDFHVFHDVSVRTDKWVYAGGEHRRSAQIDHVIAGRSGVFVIETKLWSKAFATTGRYYDPYTQVHWAGRLLHLVLSDVCGQRVRVREVIAAPGSMPPKPPASYAKVLRPAEVAGYVRWFQPELNRNAYDSVIAALCAMC